MHPSNFYFGNNVEENWYSNKWSIIFATLQTLRQGHLNMNLNAHL